MPPLMISHEGEWPRCAHAPERGSKATGHPQHGTRHVARGRAQEPHDGSCDLAGLAHPTERHSRDDAGGAVRVAGARVNVGVDEAGCDRVDAIESSASSFDSPTVTASTAAFAPA